MNNIIFKISILLIFAAVLMEIINIYYINKVSTDSIYAVNIKSQIEDLNNKNTSLKIEILKYSAYNTLSSKAKELGFVEPKEYIYLTSPIKIAVNNNEQP